MTNFVGLTDATVVKLEPDGMTLAYAGFIGGTDHEAGLGIAVCSVGSLVLLMGTTSSTDFPKTTGRPTRDGHEDGFVAKVSATGDSLMGRAAWVAATTTM